MATAARPCPPGGVAPAPCMRAKSACKASVAYGAGASVSATGEASESASVAPEFAVPEHRWGEEGDAATPDGPFALMAVPKRKVTPSRRKRRNQFKRIDFVTDVQRCRDCGKAKRPHVYCDQCSTNIYDDLKVGAGPAPGSVVP